MLESLHIGQVMAGIGIFLIGIQMLEAALKNMMSRPFKLFLRKQTSNPFKAIFGGTIVTAILQSSSAVNFMVLAFVSTGVITMRNAFAVVMGSNLGTTIDSWIIASVGFKVDIESYAYPVVGVAGLLLFIYEEKKRLKDFLSFLIGFSFLFIGLGLMKEALDNEGLKQIFGNFAGSSNFVFVLIGLAVTTITQSSSATVAITLSLLNEKLIGFESAIAVVIGSEVGTSLKLVLGSMDGIAVKKRVAFGNLFYNLITTVIGFTCLSIIARFILYTLDVDDPLIALVVFQSGMNLLNILLFLPFLNPFSRFIETLFSDKADHVSAFIYKTRPTVPDAAIDLLSKEAEYFVQRSIYFNLKTIDPETESDTFFNHLHPNDQNKFMSKSFDEQYEIIKQHLGEIQGFYIEFSKKSLNKKTADEAENDIAAVRSCMHAVKSIKDIHADLVDLQTSSNDVKYKFYELFQTQFRNYYTELMPLYDLNDESEKSNLLLKLLSDNQSVYNNNLVSIYHEESIHTITHFEIATLTNINSEIFTSHKAMIMCLKSLTLSAEFRKPFDEMPGYLY